MTLQHQNLASGRWFELSLAEQLGNIGSEYDRTLKWHEKKDGRFEAAFSRFLELLDLTISNPRLTVPQRRELIRVRESVCEEMTSDSKKNDYFQKYFFYFALNVRKNS